MLNKDKQLKFDEGSKTPVTIVSMGMEENDFGSEYVIHIKEYKGCDHIKPSEGLKNKIIESNLSEGDKIVIEKVPKSDKYKYGYFNVEMANNPVKTASPIRRETASEKGKPSQSIVSKVEGGRLELHEIALRLEKAEKLLESLGKLVAVLWTDYGNRTGDAGHKPGDDDLPF